MHKAPFPGASPAAVYVVFLTGVTLAGVRRCCDVVLTFIFLMVKNMQHDTVRVRGFRQRRRQKAQTRVLHQTTEQREGGTEAGHLGGEEKRIHPTKSKCPEMILPSSNQQQKNKQPKE